MGKERTGRDFQPVSESRQKGKEENETEDNDCSGRCTDGAVAWYSRLCGDVAGAIEGTWKTASGQIKTVVNNVVFPAIDMILAVFFFGKLGTAYFDYRKHGQFEWAGPAILFACLVFTLTAPMYVWQILGM